MERRLPSALLLALLGMSAAHAASTPYVGPYAGGDVLLERLQADRADERGQERGTLARNDRDLGWKGLVCVRMARHFAFEAGFTDFGEFTALSAATSDGPSRARARAFTAHVVGILPVGQLEAFIKAGPTRVESTGHLGSAYFDEEQRRITSGAGLQLARGRLMLRLEYEKFGTARVGDLDSISMGFRVSLGPG